MITEIQYTNEQYVYKYKPKHKSEFSKLMNAPSVKRRQDVKRKDNYYERNFLIFGNKIKPRYFCLDCKTNQCRNFTHNQIEISPFMRIPKQTASKMRWKEFFVELNKYNHTPVCKSNTI